MRNSLPWLLFFAFALGAACSAAAAQDAQAKIAIEFRPYVNRLAAEKLLQQI